MQNGNAPCRWKKSPYMSMRIISTKRKNVQLKIGVGKERMDLSSGGFFLLYVVKLYKRGYTPMNLLQV